MIVWSTNGTTLKPPLFLEIRCVRFVAYKFASKVGLAGGSYFSVLAKIAWMSPTATAKRGRRWEGTNDVSALPASDITDTPHQTCDYQAITADGDTPQKRFYRSRAHCNPLSHNDTFDYPAHPKLMIWTEYFPNNVDVDEHGKHYSVKDATPDILDIGCGFGGLTIALASMIPNKRILGLEIRSKVTEYVRLRIAALRKDNCGKYRNCAVMKTNSMKFMPNFFEKASIEKIFFCFPDPHFKKKNHSRRIISERLLSEYAYFLKSGVGRLYCITDVEELQTWHMKKCRSHPMYRELTEDETNADPCVAAMMCETEEGKKVERSGAAKYYGIFERVAEEKVPKICATDFFSRGQFGVHMNEVCEAPETC